jgi:hypothetical protein
VFGAVTNAVLSHRLSSAPPSMQGALPGDVDGISHTLTSGHESAAIATYLRDALNASTHAVFIGLLAAAALTLLILLAVPRRFPLLEDQAVGERRAG